MFDINGKHRLNCYEPCLLQNIVSYFFLDWSCLLCMYHTWKTMYELRLVKSAFYTRLLLIHLLRPLQSNDTRTLQVDPRTFVWFESGRMRNSYKTPSSIHPTCLPPDFPPVKNILPEKRPPVSSLDPTCPEFFPASVDNQQCPGFGGSNLPVFPLRQQIESHSSIHPPPTGYSISQRVETDSLIHPISQYGG